MTLSIFRVGASICLTLACLLPPTLAQASDIPWTGQRVAFAADNEPLASVLQRLFARIGVPVKTSNQVKGVVSGRFEEPLEILFEELADSYGFTYYYDGSAVFVSSIAESETQLFSLSPEDVSRLPTLVSALQIGDPRFEINSDADQGLVSAAGPPRFLERVAEVVEFIKKSPAQREATAVRPALPSVARERRQVAAPAQPSGQAVRVFKLRHARAADRVVTIGGIRTVITGVARLVANTMGQSDTSKPVPNIEQVLPVSGRGLLGQGMRTIGRTDGYDRAGGNGELTSPSFQPRTVRVRQAPQVAATPTGSVSTFGDPRGDGGLVQADQRLNAVIVRDSISRMPLYEELIRSLDQAVPLIEIEASVVDIRSDRAEALGVDFSLLLSNRPGRTSAPLIGIEPDDVRSSIAPRAEVVIGSEKNFLYARIDALKQSGDATVQSQPRVLTTDNSEAVISSSQEFFVRVAGAEVVDLFNVNVGLTLRVTPSIVVENGKTQFNLQVRIDDGSIEQVSVVDGIPVVNRSAISANVVVDEGESLFIGGLTSERTATSERSVPGLGAVPLLGRLFRSNADESRKFQRMFLLTPKLVKGVI